MKNLKNNRGVTLVELMIAIGLIAIVMGAIYAVMYTGIHSYNANLKSSQDQSNLRIAMMKLSKLRNQATNVKWDNASSMILTINGKEHVISSAQVTQPNGSKIYCLVDKVDGVATSVAPYVSGLELTPSSKGTNKIVSVKLLYNGINFETQLHVD